MQEQKTQNEIPSGVQNEALSKALLLVLTHTRPLWQTRLHGLQVEHAEEVLNTELRNAGASEEGFKLLKTFFRVWRKARQDDVAFHTVDRYLVGGAVILDLVLLQILASIGVPDLSSSLAWIAFTVSLPCAMGSLFSSFLKKENGIIAYGKVHSTLSWLSELMVLASATALIWHIWFIAGLVFLCASIVTCIICFVYAATIFLVWSLLGKHSLIAKEETEPVDAKEQAC